METISLSLESAAATYLGTSDITIHKLDLDTQGLALFLGQDYDAESNAFMGFETGFMFP